MSSHKPNLRQVLADAARVIRARPRHFLVLSVLFLLPNTICTIVYYLFLPQQPASIHANIRRSLLIIPQNENPQPMALILYVLSSLLLSLSATASITYSAFRVFYRKPVDLISSLKSVLVSFLPLLATGLVMFFIYFLISFAIGVLAVLAYNGLALMGFYMDYDSQYFVAFVALMVALLVGIMLYLQIEWALSMPVVVVESKWGFKPLKRSSKLGKGMKRVVILFILLFAVPAVALSLWFTSLVMGVKTDGISLISGLLMAAFAIVMTVLPLYSTAAQAVLYAYCKEWNGDDDEELGYARLPRSEGKEAFGAVSVVCQ